MSESTTAVIEDLFAGPGEMHDCCRSLDWAHTPLGQVALWQPALKTMVRTVLDCPFPSIVLWGDELVQIYNDGYRHLMGHKHPAGLGQPTRKCWPEAWEVNEPIFQRIQSGESVSYENILYRLNRSGALEDAWFNVSYSPIMAAPGQIGGILVIVFETTSLMLEQAKSQQAEQHKEFMLALTDALRPIDDPHLVQFEAVSWLGRFLGANRAGYAETQHDTKLVAVTKNYTNGVKGIEGVYSYIDYGADLYDRLAQGQTVVRHDVANDPTLSQANKDAHAVLDLGATLNVPLVKGDRLVAILFVHFAHAKTFSPEEIALVEETAERTWSAVETARAKSELRLSEEQLSAIVNQASAGIARGTGDGALTFVNQRYCQMLGYEAHELVGRRMQDLTHPEDRARNLQLYFNLAKTGEPFEIEKRYIRKDGSIIWVSNSVSAIFDDNGNIDELLAVSVDITARKQAETALRESEEQYRQLSIELDARVKERTRQLEASVSDLKRSNASLQQFAYVASHDLQEPLRKILQFGGRLKESYGNPARDGQLYLDRMLSATSRMTKLIDDLLNFSRVTALTGPQSPVVLEDLMKEVLTTLEVTINEHQAQVSVGALPVVTGDASQLHQLF